MYIYIYHCYCISLGFLYIYHTVFKAGPGITLESLGLGQPPIQGNQKGKKNLYIYIKKKNCIYKIKFLLEGKIKNNHNPRGKKIFKRQKKNI